MVELFDRTLIVITARCSRLHERPLGASSAGSETDQPAPRASRARPERPVLSRFPRRVLRGAKARLMLASKPDARTGEPARRMPGLVGRERDEV